MNSENGSKAQRTPSKSSRKERIVQRIQKEGFVSIDDLIDDLNVSRMTVHRDLDALEERGALRKMRGGATAQRSTQYESSLDFRRHAALEEKETMARAAAALITAGDVVMVDDSTSSLAVIQHLTGTTPLTVITNFWAVMEELREVPGINLLSLGGQMLPQYDSFYGLLTEQGIRGVFADILLASCSAVKGLDLYHQDETVIAVKREMLGSAARRVLLLDSTKVEQGALYKMGRVDEFTDVIVTEKADPSFITLLRDHGVNVIIAREEPV